VATIGGPDDAETLLESRWWWKKDELLGVGDGVDEVDVLAPVLEDALPGMVSAATTANTPTAAIEPAAIQVVSSLSRSKATSRALIRASV